ncbi:hypothetical protein NM688_g4182 [Phlebia brevispora]|uniref:Uncharacterized protein n=1 Tax=Phlebia brevispora TaxID=194682 RepID=A0ACC1T3Q6_9APHY|nr:hypothetical protein NM688_g4182 [Phlebia brevispora]
MDSPFSGVVYTDRNGSLTHLSLEEVSVDALVVDVSAKVTIRQVFSHPRRGASARAKYVFPLPARAAACAFEMRTGEGRRIIGVVKEKVQASAEHEEALKQGKTTALVEWATDDIFTISLGSIPGEQTITTVLTYVMDLLDDDSEKQIRFQIPMYVGQRYGDLPPGMVHALSPSQTRIRFNVQIQTKGQIRPQDVNSPSHPAISVARYQTHLGRPSRHRITVKYRSRQFLDKDFVLRVQAAGLELPRCFLERDDRGTVAMQLTLMPHFELPPVAAQEYIFLVDRSGSMGGSRIGTAKRTLILLLRTLPSEHTIFNIFSFGSTCDSLWESSRPYAQAALENATTYVDGMDANYAGTEIRAALQVTLRTRSRTLSTALFVLTDGESYDVDETLELVANEVARSPATAPLRVFTLGIGDTASNAMCEGIARAGNGVCLMTTTAEGIIGKCSKLVRAGRTFLLKNVTIDWGIQLDRDASPSVRFTAMDQVVRQAPSHIESIYAGVRLIVFAIIKSDKFVAPREISLHAQRDGGGDTLGFKIPVEQVKFSEDNVRNRLVHTLAARRLIMELDDPALRQSLPEKERVQSIVRLGEQYQLASRYTSFIAVDGVETEVIPPRASRRWVQR